MPCEEGILEKKGSDEEGEAGRTGPSFSIMPDEQSIALRNALRKPLLGIEKLWMRARWKRRNA